MPRYRAQYNTADEFNEFIDIYRIFDPNCNRSKEHSGKKVLETTLHVDTLDSREVIDILNAGGTPEFEFGATDVVEVGIDEG